MCIGIYSPEFYSYNHAKKCYLQFTAQSYVHAWNDKINLVLPTKSDNSGYKYCGV